MTNLLKGNISVLWRPTPIGDATFAKWWLEVSHNFVRFEEQSAVPSLVGRAHGIVLDIGAGSGNQLPRLNASRLKHVYGIESNEAFIPALNNKIKETGLEGKYTPVVCTVQDAQVELAKLGVMPGTVDSIVCIQLLCSVPDPVAVVKALHEMLKPGGVLLFWEHQENEGDFWTRMAQGAWNWLWTPVIGGCKLNSPTRKAILAAADWEVVELEAGAEALDLMPRVWGRLKKKDV